MSTTAMWLLLAVVVILILFFRLGDFYEMFFDDAKLVSKELDLTLTTRDRNERTKESETPPKTGAGTTAEGTGELIPK